MVKCLNFITLSEYFMLVGSHILYFVSSFTVLKKNISCKRNINHNHVDKETDTSKYIQQIKVVKFSNHTDLISPDDSLYSQVVLYHHSVQWNLFGSCLILFRSNGVHGRCLWWSCVGLTGRDIFLHVAEECLPRLQN